MRARIEHWMASRRPAPPRALGERLARAVREMPAEDLARATSVADALSTIGLRLLAGVVHEAPQAEGLAMDLLAADAFVTYAVEAAAEEGLSAGPFARCILHTAEAA